MPKNADKYICEICDFKCSKKSNYKIHASTSKHIHNSTNDINDIKKKLNQEYKCSCGKKYNYYSGLWRHKNICDKKICDTSDNSSPNNINVPASTNDSSNNIIELLINENKDFKNMIIELVKSNNELQKHMIDSCEKIKLGNNTVINSNNNSNNKTFNLQFFLNEECKDALNMSEFINSIELKLSDLENMGKLGYVEGMSNIIIKQLKDTDMYKRPLHCSDAKRETLYIKEENKWEKENSENTKMIGAVRGVDKKNYMMLNRWKDEHPKCMNSESNQCDDYMKLVGIVMSGDTGHIHKVIKKVSKEVIIDK